MLRTGSVSAKPVSLVATRFQRARAIAKRAISTAPPVSTIAVVAEAARGVASAARLDNSRPYLAAVRAPSAARVTRSRPVARRSAKLANRARTLMPRDRSRALIALTHVQADTTTRRAGAPKVGPAPHARAGSISRAIERVHCAPQAGSAPSRAAIRARHATARPIGRTNLVRLNARQCALARTPSTKQCRGRPRRPIDGAPHLPSALLRSGRQ